MTMFDPKAILRGAVAVAVACAEMDTPAKCDVCGEIPRGHQSRASRCRAFSGLLERP